MNIFIIEEGLSDIAKSQGNIFIIEKGLSDIAKITKK